MTSPLRPALLLGVLVSTLLLSEQAAAVQTTVFGPKQYVKAKGRPVEVIDVFELEMSGTFRFELLNQLTEADDVDNGTVTVNGIVVVSSAELRRQGSLVKFIPLAEYNQIAVKLKGKAGGPITITISGDVAANTPPIVTPNSAFIAGLVIDAASGQPIAGARVGLLGRDGVVESDGAGRYNIPTPTLGTYDVFVRKAGYTYFEHRIRVYSGEDVSVPNARLTPVDLSTTVIGPAGGTHTDSTGTVTIEIPRGSLDYEIPVSATIFARERDLPGEMTRGVAYLFCADFAPSGTVFTAPITVRVLNRWGFAPGFTIPIAYWDKRILEWVPPDNVAAVSADGQTIDFTITHFTPWDSNMDAGPNSRWGAGQNSSPPPLSNRSGEGASGNEATSCPASAVTVASGALIQEAVVPGGVVFNASRSIPLVYDTRTAAPAPVFKLDVGLNCSQTAESRSMTFEVAGIRQENTLLGTGGTVSTSRIAFAWDGVNARGQQTATGLYRYRATVANEYMSGTVYSFTDRWGDLPSQGTTISADEPYRLSDSVEGTVAVVNRRSSPFGAGWGIAETAEIVQEPVSRRVGVFEGSGEVRQFAPVFAPAASFNLGFQALALVADSKGFLFAAAYRGIYKIDPASGSSFLFHTPAFGSPSDGIGGLAIDSTDTLYYTTEESSVITKLSRTGEASAFVDLATGSNRIRPLTFYNGLLYVKDAAILKAVAPNGVQAVLQGISVSGAVFQFAINEYGQIGFAFGNQIIRIFGQACEPVRTENISHVATAVAAGAKGEFYAIGDDAVTILEIDGSQKTLRFDSPVGIAGLATSDTIFGSTNTGLARLTLSTQDFEPLDGSGILLHKTASTWTETAPGGGVRTFNASSRRLTSRRDANNNATTYLYDATGRLTRITDPNGSTAEIAYEAGYAKSITTPLGTTTLAVNGAGDLASITLPDSSQTSYVYDGQHLMTRKEPALGGAVTYEYDGRSRLKKLTLAGGEERNYTPEDTLALLNDLPAGSGTFENPAPPTSVTDARSREINGRGFETVTATAADGSPTLTTDPLGRTTRVDRFDDGRPKTVVLPDNTTYRIAYDQSVFPASLTRVGATKPEVRITYATTPAGVPRGLPATVTNAEDEATNFVYDIKGNVLSVTDPSGRASRYTYNSRGQVRTITSPDQKTTNLIYNTANGNLESITDPLGNTTSLTTSPAGFVTGATDALGGQWLFERDPLGRITATIDPEDQRTEYRYEPACASCVGGDRVKLRELIDPRANSTSFTYDALGNLATWTDPDGSAKSYLYDLNRNLATFTDFANRVTSYVYDAADQRVERHLPDGATHTYAYDQQGRLTRATNAAGDVDLIYNAAGDVTRIEQPLGPSGAQVAINQTFDMAHRRSSRTDPTGAASFSYDAAGRIETLTAGGVVHTYAYDTAGRRSQLARSNGLVSTWSYDDSGRLTNLSHTMPGFAGWTEALLPDDLSRIVTRSDPDDQITYGYDGASRLTSATHSNPAIAAESYAYDAAGNRTSSPFTATAIYDDRNRLLEDDRFTYGWDVLGNLTGKTDKANAETWTFGWSGLNQLVSAVRKDASGATLMDSSYTYDALGRRLQKQVNGTAERYLYDGANLLGTYNGANLLTKRFVVGPGVDDTLAVVTGGTRYERLTDHLNSTTFLLGPTGAVANSYRYDSFGNPLASTGTVVNPFAYTGREWDAELGMNYHRARYYDPLAGRWTSKEPLGFAGGSANLYQYAFSDPINLLDLDGLKVYPADFVGPLQPGDLTVTEVGNIVFNETRSFSGSTRDLQDNLHMARLCIAQTISNASDRFGADREKYAGTGSTNAPSASTLENAQELGAFNDSQAAASQAYDTGDMTNGAMYFRFSGDQIPAEHNGQPLRFSFGPFENSFPTPNAKDPLPATGCHCGVYGKLPEK